MDINTLNYGQRIVDLLNRDAEQARQPTVDLEPVCQLIHEASINPMTGADTISVCLAAQTALPALKSLLAEVERLREENAQLKEAK